MSTSRRGSGHQNSARLTSAKPSPKTWWYRRRALLRLVVLADADRLVVVGRIEFRAAVPGIAATKIKNPRYVLGPSTRSTEVPYNMPYKSGRRADNGGCYQKT